MTLCVFLREVRHQTSNNAAAWRALHFHISKPHSDIDTYCSLCKMMVIAKMSLMIVRAMAAPAVVMNMMMIVFYYCCHNDSVEPFTGKEKRGRYAGYITLTVGVWACSSGTGKITLSGMNVIGPQACHQHTGLQLFLDYIVKGSEDASKNCKRFYRRVFGGKCVCGCLCI